MTASEPAFVVYLGALGVFLGVIGTVYGVWSNVQAKKRELVQNDNTLALDGKKADREELSTINEQWQVIAARWEAQAIQAWARETTLQNEVDRLSAMVRRLQSDVRELHTANDRCVEHVERLLEERRSQ